jgi:hypothetical protein
VFGYSSNLSPVYYLLLLLLVFLLRAPGFDGNYTTVDTSVYLISAERIVDGGHQYLDTWEHKPPVLVWFYTLFVWLFGSGAFLAVQIFTCFYLFFCAIILNELLMRYQMGRRFSYWPAALLIVFASVPWYTLEMNSEMLLLLPMLLSVSLVTNYAATDKQSPNALFWVGMLSALMVGIRFPAMLFVGGLFLGFVVVARFQLKDLVTLAGGFGLGLFLLGYALHLNGSLWAFVEIGFLFNFDYVLMDKALGDTDLSLNFLEYLKIWGGLLLLAAVGFGAIRNRYNSLMVAQRKLETLFLFWLITGTASVLLSGRFYLHYMLQALPALVFYASYGLQWRAVGWWRVPAFVALFAIPGALSLSYPVVVCTSLYDWVATNIRQPREGGFLQTLQHQLHLSDTELALQADIHRHNASHSVFVADFRPELYTRLGVKCASKYTNINIAYFKMDWLEANVRLRGQLVSGPETLAETYRTFQREMPLYVIDPIGMFTEIRQKLPLLLDPYVADTVAGVPVWRLPPTEAVAVVR